MTTSSKDRPRIARAGPTIGAVDTARLDAKRGLPARGSGLTPRPRLVERLVASRNLPLALLVAPAGYGKTTVLAEWAERDTRPFAWLALDEGDNDPSRLLASIAHALAEIEPITSAVGVRNGGISNVAIPRLIRSLARWSTTGVLVIDDLHVLHAPAALDALSGFVDHLPAGFQLAVASRSDPALPIGRLRAQRKAVELRASALAMTSSEAAALLRSAGLMLDSEGLATLVRRTEGWPAGLYLAALSVREQSDRRRAVDEFAGDDRIVVEYMRDEFLAQLPPDRVDFLIRSSVLDRLSGSLCDAVLDRGDSALTLEALAGSNLPMVPLDRSGDSYRYHG